MADYTHIINFIKAREGGWCDNPDDLGGETNCGITYAVWCSFFGNDSHDRFLAMSDADWGMIFKDLYWDKMLGDDMNSQRIADIIVDWTWGSGRFYPEQDVQKILNTAFSGHLKTDGVFGQMTIKSINAADEPTLWNDIIAKRVEYVKNIVVNNPTQQEFLEGWLNRISLLVDFETPPILPA